MPIGRDFCVDSGFAFSGFWTPNFEWSIGAKCYFTRCRRSLYDIFFQTHLFGLFAFSNWKSPTRGRLRLPFRRHRQPSTDRPVKTALEAPCPLRQPLTSPAVTVTAHRLSHIPSPPSPLCPSPPSHPHRRPTPDQTNHRILVVSCLPLPARLPARLPACAPACLHPGVRNVQPPDPFGCTTSASASSSSTSSTSAPADVFDPAG